MENLYHSLGGTCGKEKQLQKSKVGIHATWKLTVNATEVNSQLLHNGKEMNSN